LPSSPSRTAPAGVACAGLDKEYATATGTVRALKGVDATFPASQVTAVVAPSGSGKSSLLRILACVDRPTAGSVRIGDLDVAAMGPGGGAGFAERWSAMCSSSPPTTCCRT
jgi:putative ABC transport system ATP-binding protein